MVYLVKKNAPTFVYGDFVFAGKVSGLPPLSGMRPFAIEILREYSANEFIGKLYRSNGTGWQPVSIMDLRHQPWYSMFQKAKKALTFQMDGSGIWTVEHFREESDETGTYMAVALHFKSR